MTQFKLDKNYSLTLTGWSFHGIDTKISSLIINAGGKHLKLEGRKGNYGDITINNSNIELIDIKNSCQFNTLKFTGGNSASLNFNSIKCNDNVNISGRFNLLDLRKVACPKIDISYDKTPHEMDGVAIISDNCEVQFLNISKYSSSQAIQIEKSSINDISLDGVSSKVILEGIRDLEHLIISKVENISLLELTINKLAIKDTSFNQMHFGYIHWGRNFELFSLNTQNSKSDQYLELIETSRELKKHFHDKHNLIYSNIFRVSELRSYYYYIKDKVFNNRSSFEEWLDFLVLYTNNLFSNFGTSVGKPLLFLFGFHTIWFYSLLFTEDLPFKPDFSISWSGFGYYLTLINPLHELISFNGKTVYSIFDWLMRIFSSYFIFYFIRGSRKFHS